jgi:hypothetical protein
MWKLTMGFTGRVEILAGRGTYKTSRGGKKAWTFDLWTSSMAVEESRVKRLTIIRVWRSCFSPGRGASEGRERERERERGRETEEGVLDTLDSDTMQRKSAADFRTKSRKESCLEGKWGETVSHCPYP